MTLYLEVAQRLRRQREARRLSQQDLAARLGVASNTVSRWETGSSRPRLDELDRIARTLGIGVGELIPQNSNAENRDTARLLDLLRGLHDEDLAEVERFVEFRKSRRS